MGILKDNATKSLARNINVMNGGGAEIPPSLACVGLGIKSQQAGSAASWEQVQGFLSCLGWAHSLGAE